MRKTNSGFRFFAARLGLWLMLACLCAGVLALPQTAKAEENGVAYKFDPENWMKYIPGDTDLTEINIPSTHDSGTAFVKTLPKCSRCQQYSIGDQLKNGIRMMDIRLRYDEVYYGALKFKNTLADTEDWPCETMVVSHGGCDGYESSKSALKLTFGRVLITCRDFVKAHPTETVILQVKSETALWDVTDEYKADIKKGIKSIDKLDSDRLIQVMEYEQYSPTLDDIRGQVIIFVEENHEFPTSYHYGNMNNPEAADAPARKIKLAKAALDSSGWQDTKPKRGDIYDPHSILVREPNLEQEDEKPRFNEGRPVFQQICTNATDVRNFSSTALPTYGPIGYAEAMRYALKDYDWIVGKRYGAVRMDFPSREVIRKVVETNNSYVRFQADIVWDDDQKHILDNGLKIELAENGTALKMPNASQPVALTDDNGFRVTYENVLQRSKTGEWYGGASFRAADGCEYALTFEPVVETREWFTDSKKVAYLGFVRTQKIHVGKLETKTYDLPVYFMSETDDRPFRPEMTPQAFIDHLGDLFISYKTSDGYQHTPSVTYWSKGALYNLDSITEASENQWILHITVPKYDRNGNEQRYHFSDLKLRTNSLFMLCDCGHSDGIGLKLPPADETVEEVINYYVFADYGKDQFGEKTMIDNALMTGGIRHIAETEDGTVFVDEEITDPSLKSLKNGDLLLLTVRKYDDGFHKLYHRFEPLEVPHFSVSVENGVWSYRLMTNLNVNVYWDDSSDYAEIRPGILDITFLGKSKQGDVLTNEPVEITMTKTGNQDECDLDRWLGTVEMPVLYSDLSGNAGNILNPEEGLTKLSVPGYRIDSINKTTGTDESGIPTYTFDIKLRIDTSAKLYVDVSGSVIFNDADLSITHSLEGLQLYVRQNGKYMEDPQIKRDDYDDCTYSFKPKELFPAFRNLSSDITPHPYTYTIEAGRYLGDYELQGTFGFDVYYLRHVSVSGAIDWKDGMRPEREPSVKVELLRDGEPTGLTTYTDAQHQYVFDHLPITEGDERVPYQYSIRATLSSDDGKIVYHTVERDLTNGNITADADIVPAQEIPPVDIPVRLELKNADPATEPEAFTFELVCTSDSGIAPVTVTLNRENGFSGALRVEGLTELNHVYQFEVKQNVSLPKSYWQYDTTPQTASAEIIWTDGPGPAVQLKLPGGTDHLSFTNLYTGTGAVAGIKLTKKIENQLAGIKDAPEKTFTFSLYSVEEGVPTLVDYAKITGEGAVQFDRLRFDRPGTYHYQVSEIIPDDLTGWVYDRQTVPVEIEVKNEDGVMQTYVSTVPVFTNLYENEYYDISVRVLWEGTSKKYPIPQSVNVKLSADGADADEADAGSKTDWICKFPNMPGFSKPMSGAKKLLTAARPIEYTVSADEVRGYTQTVLGDAKTGFTIVYTLKSPKTGDDAQLALWFLLLGGAMITMTCMTRIARRKRG